MTMAHEKADHFVPALAKQPRLRVTYGHSCREGPEEQQGSGDSPRPLTYSECLTKGIIPDSKCHFFQGPTMERELIDRAENIQKRILQLRDSL